MLGFIAKKKEELINQGAAAVAAQFKEDILRLLGEDAREEDVKAVEAYFAPGSGGKHSPARLQAEKALKNAGIL